ncbi:MAG: pirin family protein [Deltaproteobacteria bacterium]|nr:pirin family protein [Deltaproteobacteria bacterium]
MSSPLVLERFPLGLHWPAIDPFLFCAHHADRYPRGNGALGPAASLAGRALGHDFEGQDGWRMYHGTRVPGFPQHPHRGFETITIVTSGYCDHSDSLGARARFGEGDVQWLTAGSGIVHSEMFPLLRSDVDNPLELFQLWLNLPRASKMVPPHFSMRWREQLPVVRRDDGGGRHATVTVVAGDFDEVRAAPAPPHSYAARADSDVGVWLVALDAGARLTVPPAPRARERMIYLYRGAGAHLDDDALVGGSGARVRADAACTLRAGPEPCGLLLLQGAPLGEPVAWHGPFVMNTPAELEAAYRDYHTTRFGGWPFERDDPVHGAEPRRFARYPDGREEQPPSGR